MLALYTDVVTASNSCWNVLATARRQGSPSSVSPTTQRRSSAATRIRADGVQDRRRRRTKSVSVEARARGSSVGAQRQVSLRKARSFDKFTRPSEIASCASFEIEGQCARFVYGSASSANTSKSFRILCYGDSNTIGFRGEGKTLKPYGQELADALRVAGYSCEVTCCGLCGLTSEELAIDMDAPRITPMMGPSGEGLAHMLREGSFDLVVIMVGTNDLGKFVDTRMTQAFVTRLHGACHALGIPTVNIAPPTVHDNPRHMEIRCKIRDSRKRLADLMGTWARSCPHVLLSLDCEAVVPSTMSHLWEQDEIHLSVQGSKQLGKSLAAQLTLVLGQLKQRQPPSFTSARRGSPMQVQPVVQEAHRVAPVGSIMTIQNRQRPRAVASTMGVYATCGRTALVGVPAVPAPRMVALCY